MKFRLMVVVLFFIFTSSVICIENNEEISTRTRRKLKYPKETNKTNKNEKETRHGNSRAVSVLDHTHHNLTQGLFGFKVDFNRKNYMPDRSQNIKSYNLTESRPDFTLGIPNSEKNEVRLALKDTKQKHREESKIRDSALAGTEIVQTKKRTSSKDQDDEEKTLSQQVADGKYGLIQNELFANGSKRPGILSYLSNSEVPKDTKENLGGLEKDEIWLAEDHILVLRGGRFKDNRENGTSSSIWPPIDDYSAPNRQVKIPKNPKIPPPFPVQLTENGPLELINGNIGSNANSPTNPLFSGFPLKPNMTLPFLYGTSRPPAKGVQNVSTILSNPPFPLPPFLGQFPPGATFLSPPQNSTDIDEDDPSIYYPPKYDFFYSQTNNSPVPPGPLVPGIILPPPPDFFAPLENETIIQNKTGKNEPDIINAIDRPTFAGPKYLPAEVHQSDKLKHPDERNFKHPPLKESDPSKSSSPTAKMSPAKEQKPFVAYVYPENLKQKDVKNLSSNSLKNSNIKVPAEENIEMFDRPIVATMSPSIYHPLPTTSPKPNHITVPGSLSKDIYIVTTPESEEPKKIDNVYKEKTQPITFLNVRPELHPLRSLIRPNISVSYTGKYGHLPPSKKDSSPNFLQKKPQPAIGGHYITLKPPVEVTQNSITSEDINVSQIPILKKVRFPLSPVFPEKIKPPFSTISPSKATFYFYEEPSKPEISQEILPLIKSTKQTLPNRIEPNGNIGPISQYYNTATLTTKIPVRQFLEETFYSSNAITTQSPHLQNTNSIGLNNLSPGKPKIKSLEYKTNEPTGPILMHQYETEVPPLIIPSHKIKVLEIQNSGSTGLQKVNLEKANIQLMSKPFFSPDIVPSPKPQSIRHFSSTLSPLNSANPPSTPNVNDTPFIPSNYYATARPEHIHFTSHEQTLVDDITKNYFTIFGQKINSVSTTPLTPVQSSKPQGLATRIKGKNVQIIPQDQTSYVGRNSVKIQNKTATGNIPTPPSSNFEQYLKEITGEDQKDYIVTDVQGKIIKTKNFLSLAPFPGVFPAQLYPSGSVPLQPLKLESSIQPTPGVVYSQKVLYRPNHSTTLRPVLNVEVTPEFVRHITNPPRPIKFVPTSGHHKKSPLPHNLGQYLQEITGFTSPSTINPITIKNHQVKLLIPPSESSMPDLQTPSNLTKGNTQKPLSLESNIMVNFKPSLPRANHLAEPTSIKTVEEEYIDEGSNIKIVESPDLTKEKLTSHVSDPFLQKSNKFDSTKHFFQNLPSSGYFSPSHQTTSNSFVSYNLPGNGGHFYFLTPQIVEKPNEQRAQNRVVRFNKAQTSSRIQYSSNYFKNNYRNNYSTDLDHNLTNGYSNHDYIRRRRKKL